MSRFLLVGAGDARDHAIWLRLRAEGADVSMALMGANGLLLGAPGVERVADVGEAVALAIRSRPDVVVVQRPELLLAGAVDRLRATGARVVGPPRAAAELEGSKVWSKALMDAHCVATPAWRYFERPEDAIAFLAERWPRGEHYVVKADRYLSQAHLRTATPASLATALDAVAALAAVPTVERGERILLERRVDGEELSVHLLLDGRGGVSRSPPVSDYKALFDGDAGPNTHGMGAVAAPCLAPADAAALEARVIGPTLAALAAEGLAYAGVLYIGVMFTAEGPVALEYNVRPGNPEWPTLLPLLDGRLADAFHAMAEGTLRPVGWHAGRVAATVFLTVPGYPFVAQVHDARVQGLADVLADPEVTVLGEGIRASEGLRAGTGRSVALVASGDDVEAVRARIYDRVERIRFPGMHYRTDIGLGRPLIVRAPGRVQG